MANFKCCDNHTLRIRAQLEERELGRFIYHDPDKQRQVLERLQHGRGQGDVDFDPFILAQLRVAQQLSNCMDPPHMVDMFPDGTCPLCVAHRQMANLDTNWIRGVTDELLFEAYERQLMTKKVVR